MRLLGITLLVAGQQVPRDSVSRPDTTRAVTLPAVHVSVTRTSEDRGRLPMAVGVLDSTSIRRAQLTVGLDEALSRLPGVVVLNRYNYSLDQRVSLRGAGSRANFGLRGVKVLIDGVPQTLPDGQSQLTNLELGLVNRVEVLTGSAGALYGNASGGVLSFSTENPMTPWTARLRVSGGSFGTWKGQTVVGTAQGRARGVLSVSQFVTDGFRQHSAAKALQLSSKIDVSLGSQATLGLRFGATDAPEAQHPGALTQAEYDVTRDSAASANLLRGADKSVQQQQASLRFQWTSPGGATLDAIAFGYLRQLLNPLATPPPSPPPPTSTSGTYSTIDRRAGGIRVTGTLPVYPATQVLRVAAGVDLQAMRDLRQNTRSARGRLVGFPFVDQRETVRELGPFAQVHWEPVSRVVVLGAARYDRLVFRVDDQLKLNGIDRGGERVMSRPSGSLGISVIPRPDVTFYANGSTSFESPTTTELVNTTGDLGFNTTLNPQRTLSGELGVRGRLGAAVGYSFSGFVTRIRDAIIQAREVDGRAFFENAGKVRNKGIEGGLELDPWPWLSFRGAYTYASYRFSEYRIRSGATTDTLDGKRLAGVPQHFLRATLSVRRGPVELELDQVTAGSMFGDDKNTLPVEGWGVGVSSARLSGDWRQGETALRPFVAIHNIFNREYVGSVNINGVGGRVLEPAAGRAAYLGMEISWAGTRR